MRRQTKQNPNTICVGHHYSQANINNVSKTCALLQQTVTVSRALKCCYLSFNAVFYPCVFYRYLNPFEGPSWSYGSWIYNYVCSQCPSPLKLWVQIPLRRGVLDKTLCGKVYLLWLEFRFLQIKSIYLTTCTMRFLNSLQSQNMGFSRFNITTCIT